MGRKSAKNASDSRGLGATTTVGLDFDTAPFAEGASREAFRATVQRGGCYKGYTDGTKLVLKTFKPYYYNQGLRVSEEDVRMQAQVKALADLFNESEGGRRRGRPCNIHVRVACLDRFQTDHRRRGEIVFKRGECFLLEQTIHGTFQKFNSNTGWTSGDDVMDAFSHWTWHMTRSMVVCDLQGVRGGPGEPLFGGSRERYYYLITDPAVNSEDKRYGVSDLGLKGIQTFFHRHVCNEFCGAGWHRPKGVRHFGAAKESSYDSLLGIGKNPSSHYRSTLGALAESDEEYSDSEESSYGGYSDSTSSGSTIKLYPDEIFFTHDSINRQFSCGRYVRHTYEQLLHGDTDVRDIPLMTVTWQGGKYWTYTGNRRLWVFRRLRADNRVGRIRVELTDSPILRRKFTTMNGGTSVRIRE